MLRRIAPIAFVGCIAAHAAHADTLTLAPEKDATLIEDAAGALASGASPDLYAGRTGQAAGSIRRAALRFDLSAIPNGAVIEGVRLRIQVTSSGARAGALAIARLEGAFGEGPSFHTGGGGAPALPGDATWLERAYDPALASLPGLGRAKQARWETPGGDFAAEPSATRSVTGNGPLLFDGPGLVADVQEWVRSPRRNDGWLVTGDEASSNTVRRFASRENLMVDQRPRLEVVYRAR